VTINNRASSQLHIRMPTGLMSDVRALARRRRLRYSQLVRSVLTREISQADTNSGSTPDESAIREMAILIAVELVLKLQEASIPGGVTLSRRLLEDAARAAISHLELVESKLHKGARR
jgi:hypothetical protein